LLLMSHLAPHELLTMLLALALLLGVARLLGQIAMWLHQPAVLGEMLAGVLLGPTVLGYFSPQTFAALFPATGPNALALDVITNLSIVLYLLVAGLEVDLSTIWRQGLVALKVGAVSVIVPFAIGLAAAWGAPRLLGQTEGADPVIFTLFFGTAMAISALPVIIKTLFDLDMYRTDLGMIVVSAAVLNDLLGWTVFAVILGMMDAGGERFSPVVTIGLTLVFAGLVLTVGRWLNHKVLPYLQAYTASPSGVLGYAMTMAFLGAAFTEWIGIHAIFGSFLVGIAIGDSSHLRERTRFIIDQFISFIFAPVFFASIGLRVNFVDHFHLPLVASVFAIACIGKLIGATVGARWAGMPRRESWALGFAMNARGAMEIILGLLALQAGVIDNRLFVALVVTAIGTSALSGPVMLRILGHRKPRRLLEAFSPRLFLRDLSARTRREAIHELIVAACGTTKLEAESVEISAWERETTTATGIGNGVALPHARVPGLAEPLIAVGLSEAGIDFDAPDGEPAHAIFLILTPLEQPNAQLQIASELARKFRDRRMLDLIVRAANYTEFLAVMKSAAPA
jgi:Kef-type K+ transport system membrane component KefB/mannitol/fructose-specific phosphotransferase system IIA component